MPQSFSDPPQPIVGQHLQDPKDHILSSKDKNALKMNELNVIGEA